MTANESEDDLEKMGELWASVWRKRYPEIEIQQKRDRENEILGIQWRYRADLIEREWQQRIGTSFPGWTEAALTAVIGLAGLGDKSDQLTAFEVYHLAIEVLAEPMQPPVGGVPESDGDHAIYHGRGLYQVGKQWIRLSGCQADVLETLVKLCAATFEQLQISGTDNPSAVLTSIRNGHPLLAPFIKMAGRKGGGGYSTTICNRAGK